MKKQIWKRALMILLALALAGAVCIGALMGLIYAWEVNVPQSTDYDSIIVLGAQVLPTGEPSVQLQWRLDKGMECYWENPCYIVVCGAQGANEPEPEADVMRRVLLAAGLPEEHVIADPDSKDTKQNIRNALDILKKLECKTPLIVTSDYHLPRAMAIARDNGIDPRGAGSPCKPGVNFWVKNHLREALAWVKYWGIKYLKLPL